MYKRQLGDVWSTNNCPLIFCASGRARWCSNKAVPSAWIKRESVRWRYDERYLERELCVDREIELFEISRSYRVDREVRSGGNR